jgi:hypothetical protein
VARSLSFQPRHEAAALAGLGCILLGDIGQVRTRRYIDVAEVGGVCAAGVTRPEVGGKECHRAEDGHDGHDWDHQCTQLHPPDPS